MGAKLGQWIRDRRVEKGLTQSDLAGKLKVSQPQVSQWERGLQDPGPEVLERLRRLFGEPAAGSQQRRGTIEPERTSRAQAATPRPAATTKSAGLKTAAASRKTANGTRNGGDLGFEAKLWAAADKLRGNIDSAE